MSADARGGGEVAEEEGGKEERREVGWGWGWRARVMESRWETALASGMLDEQKQTLDK